MIKILIVLYLLYQNIQEEYFPSNELKLGHDDLDTMLEWIKMNTEKDAVFAGMFTLNF